MTNKTITQVMNILNKFDKVRSDKTSITGWRIPLGNFHASKFSIRIFFSS